MTTIEKVIKVYPIKEADAIEMTQVLDFHVVTLKGQFKAGDLLVYSAVDSIMPDGLSDENKVLLSATKKKLKGVTTPEQKLLVDKEIEEVKARNTRPEFEFLRGKDFKIKALKYGKFTNSLGLPIVSQGICFDISILPAEVTPVEGMDVTEILGVLKIVEDPDEVLGSEVDDEEENTNTVVGKLNKVFMRYPLYRRLRKEITGTKIKGTWQPWMPEKSDEEKIQRLFTKLFAIYGTDAGWVGTEKLEGQSLGTYRINNKKFFGFIDDVRNGVNSRNVHLPTFDGSRFWQSVLQEGYIEKLNSIGKDLFIRGEHLGPGIQGNIYGLVKHEIPLYEVYELTKKGTPYKFNHKEFMDFCKLYDFKTCPILYDDFAFPSTVDEMLALADGKSALAEVWREGIVFRRKEDYRVSFKDKSQEYELRKNMSKEYPGKPVK